MTILKASGKWINVGVVVAVGIALSTGLAMANQPEMQNSLGALEAAQNSLNLIHEDKGGHASAARRLVAKAIEQVQEGIAYGDAHGD